MSANLNALATLFTALATLVTAIGGVWIGIRGRQSLSDKIQTVHSMTDDLHTDIATVKKDVFAMTGVLTQSITPRKPPG